MIPTLRSTAFVMMMAGGSATFAGLVSSAEAGEPVPTAATGQWTGFFVGGYAGGSNASAENGYDFSIDFDGVLDVLDDAESGGAGTDWLDSFAGAQIGYDHQIGRLVLGLAADFTKIKGEHSTLLRDADDSVSYTGITGTTETCIPFVGCFDGPEFGTVTTGMERTIESTVDVEWLTTMRARAGLALGDRFLVYGTGGAAYGEINTALDYEIDGYSNGVLVEPLLDLLDVSEHAADSEKAWGWTAGAGFEAFMFGHMTLFAEYQYTDLGDANVLAVSSAEGNIVVTEKTEDIIVQTGRIGVNVRF